MLFRVRSADKTGPAIHWCRRFHTARVLHTQLEHPRGDGATGPTREPRFRTLVAVCVQLWVIMALEQGYEPESVTPEYGKNLRKPSDYRTSAGSTGTSDPEARIASVDLRTESTGRHRHL